MIASIWKPQFCIFLGLALSATVSIAGDPSLVTGSNAPAGMNIVPKAVTLRLHSPKIKYQLYAAKSFPSTQDSKLSYLGYVYQTTLIKPSGSSFRDIFQQEWFDVTPGSGSNELILAFEMSSLLGQPGVPVGELVSLGRWAITELRLTSRPPVNPGDVVSYTFNVMCYVPAGATTGGGILTLFEKAMTLSFPMGGVAIPSVTPAGHLDTGSVMSPSDFSFTVTNLPNNVVREEMVAVPVMTDIRA